LRGAHRDHMGCRPDPARGIGPCRRSPDGGSGQEESAADVIRRVWTPLGLCVRRRLVTHDNRPSWVGFFSQLRPPPTPEAREPMVGDRCAAGPAHSDPCIKDHTRDPTNVAHFLGLRVAQEHGAGGSAAGPRAHLSSNRFFLENELFSRTRAVDEAKAASLMRRSNAQPGRNAKRSFAHFPWRSPRIAARPTGKFPCGSASFRCRSWAFGGES